MTSTMATRATQIGAVQRRLHKALHHPLPTMSRLSRTSSLGGPLALFYPTASQHLGGAHLMSSAPSEQPTEEQPPQPDARLLSQIYNQNRALYKKSVSHLRKTYFAEIQSQRERDAAVAAAADAKKKREVLERRRLKAVRAADNAMRQIRKAEERRIEWEKELEVTQKLRDRKKALYQKARQRIVDQLEAECHLWLTTEEEVERALGNPTASQILWARPGGIIGAPSGSSTGFGDEDFWRYESHTWDARPIYKNPAEIMLEELEEMSYLQANISTEYWTDEKVRKYERREERARLRAIVREEGRRALLEKQRELMRDLYGSGAQEEKKGVKLPPSAMPAPKLDYLADYDAQEREGVEILKRDARKFFIFESDLPGTSNLGGHHSLGAESDNPDDNLNGDSASSTAQVVTGASLGRPIALRNPFFSDRPTPFPLRVGRDLPKDSRTEKEKKRDERQERMRAAAEEAALAAKTGTAYEIAMAAEEDLDDGSEDVNYDFAEDEAEKELWEGQMGEWSAMDKRVFNMTPPFKRLTNDEIDWMLEKLKSKTKQLQERIDFEDKFRKQELASSGDKKSRPLETLDDVDRYVMQDLGYDMDMLEAMVKELTPEQSAALEEIDFSGRVDITMEEMEMEVRKVPGLTDSQVKLLVEMEMSLLKNEALSKITKMG
eukprot:CCRYP_014176-RA/>CCRYP_014176-RA protein AED:0.33 eAED:0.33 QI:47/1/1/1/1/1/2/191/664